MLFFIAAISFTNRHIKYNCGNRYHKEQGHSHQKRNRMLLDLCCIGGNEDTRSTFRNLNPASAHKQSVCIRAVGSARHERAVIPVFLNKQCFHLIGLDDLYLIDFVRQQLVEHPDVEYVTLIELFQVAQKRSSAQSVMSRENTVCTSSADGQRRPFEMTNAGTERLLVRPVENRKGYVDIGYLNIPHNAFAARIEERIILRSDIVGKDKVHSPL